MHVKWRSQRMLWRWSLFLRRKQKANGQNALLALRIRPHPRPSLALQYKQGVPYRSWKARVGWMVVKYGPGEWKGASQWPRPVRRRAAGGARIGSGSLREPGRPGAKDGGERVARLASGPGLMRPRARVLSRPCTSLSRGSVQMSPMGERWDCALATESCCARNGREGSENSAQVPGCRNFVEAANRSRTRAVLASCALWWCANHRWCCVGHQLDFQPRRIVPEWSRPRGKLALLIWILWSPDQYFGSRGFEGLRFLSANQIFYNWRQALCLFLCICWSLTWLPAPRLPSKASVFIGVEFHFDVGSIIQDEHSCWINFLN